MDGYVRIYKDPNKWRTYKVSSTHSFFNNDRIRVSINDDAISLTIPTLDYKGRSSKTGFAGGKKQRARKIAFISKEEIPTGKFLIDTEDITEDEMIIYFEELI